MQTIDDRIAAKKADLGRLRPITGRSLAALNAWYDVELTYTSNAIEGNTLTRNETAVILEKGITVGGKPLKDHLEAVGHKEALDYVRVLARRNEPVRESDVRQIHLLVVGRAEPEDAGRYSTHQRQILGSSLVPTIAEARTLSVSGIVSRNNGFRAHATAALWRYWILVLPSPAQIGPLMGDFGQWLARETAKPPSPDTAFDAHEKLVTIHPFTDGNGRTARLLMNLVLLKGGYPPVVIGPEQRVAYLDGLQALQVGGDPAPYQQFMAERLESSMDHHLSMLRRGLDQAVKPSLGGPKL